MNWKKKLEILEQQKKWDSAIELMERVIQGNPNNMDAYIYIIYFFMNLLVEEDYDKKKYDYYENLATKYFQESYPKFSNNPEYLFFVGMTTSIAEWIFGIKDYDAYQMLYKAIELEPNNLLYQCTEIGKKSKEEQLNYYKIATASDSPVIKHLKTKGAVGKYLLQVRFSKI